MVTKWTYDIPVRLLFQSVMKLLKYYECSRPIHNWNILGYLITLGGHILATLWVDKTIVMKLQAHGVAVTLPINLEITKALKVLVKRITM